MKMLNFWWNLATLLLGTSLTPVPPPVIAHLLLHACVQMVTSGKRTWLKGAHAGVFVEVFKRVSSFRIMRGKGDVEWERDVCVWETWFVLAYFQSCERSGKKELLLLCTPNLKRRTWDTANGQSHTSRKKNHFWDRFLVDDTLTPAR